MNPIMFGQKPRLCRIHLISPPQPQSYSEEIRDNDWGNDWQVLFPGIQTPRTHQSVWKEVSAYWGNARMQDGGWN